MLKTLGQSVLPYFHCGSCDFAVYCTEEGSCSQHQTNQRPVVKQIIHLKPNELLPVAKNKLQSLYAIQHGALKAYQIEASGKEIVRGFHFAGEAFGYEILSGNYPYNVSALCDTVICEILFDDIFQASKSEPNLQKHLLSLTSQQLTHASYLFSSTAEQRFTGFLIDLASRLNLGKFKSSMTLPMTRQDIGNYLRLTAETISRLCSRLQKSNLIAIEHKKIELLDMEALKNMADGLVMT